MDTRLITEAFQNGTFKIVSPEGAKSNSAFGKNKKLDPYVMQAKVGDSTYNIYSAHSLHNMTDFLQNIKDPKYANDADRRHIIERVAIYAVSLMRKHDINVVISTGSSSGFLGELINAIKRRVSNVLFYENIIHKNDVTKLVLDRSRVNVTDKQYNDFVRDLHNFEPDENGLIYPKYKKVRKSMLRVVGNTHRVEMPENTTLVGHRIMVIDDVLATGVTLKNVIAELHKHNPQHLIAFTPFKTKS